MERLFAGEVFDMIPCVNGVVFSYKKAAVGEKLVVDYQMLSVDNSEIVEVTNSVYLLAKFGGNYRSVVKLCDNHIKSKTIVMPSGRVFICSDTGTAALIDGDGQQILSGELKYRGYVPSDIAVSKNGLWAVFSKPNVLVRFNPSTLREEIRIGGSVSPFDCPNGIFIEENRATVSNSGSNKLVEVNLDTYDVKEISEFTQSVYSYTKINGQQLVLLESGIYRL